MVLGASLFGRSGIALSLVFVLFALLVLAAYSEKGIARALQASLPSHPALERSLARAWKDLRAEGMRPQVRIIPDPAPNALTARSIFGRGTLFITQGLFTSLNEGELRAVLRVGAEACQEPGMVFRSLCSFLAIMTVKLMPLSVKNGLFRNALSSIPKKNMFLTPSRTLLGWMAIPFLQLFMVSSLRRRSLVPAPASYNDATQKMDRVSRLFCPLGNPGASGLYLQDAWSAHVLVSFTPHS